MSHHQNRTRSWSCGTTSSVPPGTLIDCTCENSRPSRSSCIASNDLWSLWCTVMRHRKSLGPSGSTPPPPLEPGPDCGQVLRIDVPLRCWSSFSPPISMPLRSGPCSTALPVMLNYWYLIDTWAILSSTSLRLMMARMPGSSVSRNPPLKGV